MTSCSINEYEENDAVLRQMSFLYSASHTTPELAHGQVSGMEWVVLDKYEEHFVSYSLDLSNFIFYRWIT
jgi:hypothetical protein